jgi:hypothetical protein
MHLPPFLPTSSKGGGVSEQPAALECSAKPPLPREAVERGPAGAPLRGPFPMRVESGAPACRPARAYRT